MPHPVRHRHHPAASGSVRDKRAGQGLEVQGGCVLSSEVSLFSPFPAAPLQPCKTRGKPLNTPCPFRSSSVTRGGKTVGSERFSEDVTILSRKLYGITGSLRSALGNLRRQKSFIFLFC